MKKFSKVLMCLIVVMMMLSLIACSNPDSGTNNPEQSGTPSGSLNGSGTVSGSAKEGYLHVVDASGTVKSYSVNTEETELSTLKDLLDYFADKEEFSYTESGGMVISVNGITADSAKHEFWAIYTDVKIGNIPYYDNSWGTAKVNDVEYGSATKGIAELPISVGATYVLKVSTW